MEKAKKVGLHTILEEIKSGLSPAQISRKHNLPKQNISYFVGKLKGLGCIEKIGYGVWKYLRPLKEVKDLTTTHSGQSVLTSQRKEIRGHAFIWKIEFVKPFDWSRAVNNYQKKKLTFQLMEYNRNFRTIFKNRKIWLGKKGLTIYEPIDFMGKSSFEVKGRAVFEMDLLIKGLLQELGLKMRQYRFTTSREHYGIVKNELARQYNDRKQKMEIKSDDGDIWMWIDDSKGLGELENAEPNVNRQVQNFWNNHRKHDFKIDGDFVVKGFEQAASAAKENADNVAFHMENMRSHVGATRDLSAATKLLNKSLEKQNELFAKMNQILEKKL